MGNYLPISTVTTEVMTPALMGTKALFVASAGALVVNAAAKSENREPAKAKKYLSGTSLRNIRLGNRGVTPSRTVKAPVLLCVDPGLSHILVTHTPIWLTQLRQLLRCL